MCPGEVLVDVRVGGVLGGGDLGVGVAGDLERRVSLLPRLKAR